MTFQDRTELFVEDFNWHRRDSIIEVIVRDRLDVLSVESDCIKAACYDSYGYMITERLAGEIAEANEGPCKLTIQEFTVIGEWIVTAEIPEEEEDEDEDEVDEDEDEEAVNWQQDGF